MGLRKFFFDLLYVRGDMAARHPDFFYLYDEFYLKPRSLEKVVRLEKGRLVTERNEYIVRDGVLFKVPWGDGERIVEWIVGSDEWRVLRGAGRVYYVSIEPGRGAYVVYFIDRGRFIYPVRVVGRMATIYFPNGYITADVDGFRFIKSFDDAFKLGRIYSYSFVGSSAVEEVMEEVGSLKGAKFVVYPGMGFIWRGAYTVKVTGEGSVMIEPVDMVVDDPVLSVMLPYHVNLFIR